MRALLVRRHAHPSEIPLSVDVPVPIPKPDQVVVDIYSAGLNFFDILQAQGKYQVKPPRPFVLGSEFAGRIAQDSPIPEGCPFKPGDKVFGASQGAYADKLAAKWAELLPLPPGLSFDEGAGIYLTWPTSYEGLVGRAGLKTGEWVLVTASAGGVGIAAVQIAKALGARVIAAAGSSTKLDIAKRYGGADYVVNYTKPQWQKEVMKITGNHGADVIYDPVGIITDCLKCIAWKGRALVIGFAAGQIEKVPMNLVLLKNVTIMGLHWGAYTFKEPSRIPVVWETLLGLFASGRIKPVMFSEIYPLERVVEGLSAVEQRKTWGKVIIRIKNERIAKL